jgi:hypothetical protein
MREPRVKEANILQLFDDGRRPMTRKQAAEELEVIAGVKRSAAYDALKPNGCFASLLAEDPSTGLIGLKSGDSSNADNAE